MYEGEGLGRVIIDLDAVLGEAASMMVDRNDVNYTVGRAINELYAEKLKPLRDRMDMILQLGNQVLNNQTCKTYQDQVDK